MVFRAPCLQVDPGPELVLHGREVPGLPPDHDGLLARADGRLRCRGEPEEARWPWPVLQRCLEPRMQGDFISRDGGPTRLLT